MKQYTYEVEIENGRIVRLLCACDRWLDVDEHDQADCPDCSVRFNRVNRPDRPLRRG